MRTGLRWRLPPRARSGWYPAAALMSVIGGAVAGAALVLIPGTGGTAAAACGLVRCGVSVPAPALAGPARSRPAGARAVPHHAMRPARGPVRPAPAGPAPAPPLTKPPAPPLTQPPAPSPSPSAAKPAARRVAVSYTLDWQRRGRGRPRFAGHLTIVNRGRTAIPSWQLRLTMPGDHVEWVGYPRGSQGRQFTAWQFSGATLVLRAAARGETLAPGETMIVPLSGNGPRHSPDGLTFVAGGRQ